MNVLIVDDEALVLAATKAAVESALPNAHCYAFSKAREALEFAQTTPIALAFLDIDMRVIDGISMARALCAQYPQLNIIFCTGYPQYAMDAVSVYFSDYILKPITPEKIRNALQHLRHPMPEALLRVRVAGGFEAYDRDATPLHFRRTRAKELLAMLIHQHGNPIAPWQISEQLWCSAPIVWNERSQNYFYQQFYELNRVLRAAGMEQLLKRTNDGSLFLDMALIYVDDTDCEALGYMNGCPFIERLPG